MQTKPKNIEDYIAAFPEETRNRMEQIRCLIREGAPEAEESISYGLPAYKLAGKPLVYFGGFKTHIGLYATPTGHEAFKEELSVYKQGKGSVQFPLDTPLPIALIKKIVEFRVKENLQKQYKSG